MRSSSAGCTRRDTRASRHRLSRCCGSALFPFWGVGFFAFFLRFRTCGGSITLRAASRGGDKHGRSVRHTSSTVRHGRGNDNTRQGETERVGGERGEAGEDNRESGGGKGEAGAASVSVRGRSAAVELLLVGALQHARRARLWGEGGGRGRRRGTATLDKERSTIHSRKRRSKGDKTRQHPSPVLPRSPHSRLLWRVHTHEHQQLPVHPHTHTHTNMDMR